MFIDILTVLKYNYCLAGNCNETHLSTLKVSDLIAYL